MVKSNSILILDEVYNKHGILLPEVNEFRNRNRARNVSADYSIICRKFFIVEYFLNDWKQQYCISIFAFPHRNQKCRKTFWLLISPRSFSFFQLKSDQGQLFIFKANIWFLLSCPINVLDIQFFLRFSNTGFVFHGHFLHRHNFCFTGNLKTKILGCKKFFTLKMNCYMWHIAVESSTLPTRHEVQSTTLSTTRPADFTPFFVEFWVSLRYFWSKIWVY